MKIGRNDKMGDKVKSDKLNQKADERSDKYIDWWLIGIGIYAVYIILRGLIFGDNGIFSSLLLAVVFLIIAGLGCMVISKVFRGAERVNNLITTTDKVETMRTVAVDTTKAKVSLLLGKSTGILSDRGHANGIRKGETVWLTDDDCCQNIIAIGGIGAGKTTRVINPVLDQLLRQKLGGLIFDIKGDFKETVYALAQANNRPVVTVGIGNRRINILKGLTVDQASSYLQSAFILTTGGKSDFWLQSATDLCRNVLGLLDALGEEYYNLETLYQYIFIDSVRAMLSEQILDKVKSYGFSQQGRLLQAYYAYYNDVFLNLDVKMRESIKGTLSVVLSPFQNPQLIDTFSNDDFRMDEILAGSVVLVDLPLSRWGVAGKVVYTMLKLRFFSLLQERQSNKSLHQDYVFFMCDEYQEIISASRHGLSDLSFWDKSRSAKCIGVVSTQSVNSFRSVIDSQSICDTILANFRQKIFFRTEDTATIKLMNELCGRVEILRENISTSKGSSHKITDVFSTSSSNTTKTETVVERNVIEPHVIRELDNNTAIAILGIKGVAADDVIQLQPKYI